VFDLGFVRFRSGDWGLRVFFFWFSVYWSKLVGGGSFVCGSIWEGFFKGSF